MKDKYKVMFLSYFCLLFFCFFLKLLGSKYFELACDIEGVKKLCNFISTHKVLDCTISFLVFTISTSIYLEAVVGVKRLKFGYYIAVAVLEIVRIIFEYRIPLILYIIDIIIMFGIPLFINKKLVIKTIISFLMLFIFELISMSTKLITQIEIKEAYVALIYSIDYYIMILIYKKFCLEIKNQEERKGLWEHVGFYY